MKRLIGFVLLITVFPAEVISQETQKSPEWSTRTTQPAILPFVIQESKPRRMSQVSWIHIPSAAPKEIKIHDIITVLVDEKSTEDQSRRFNSQKNGIFKLELKEFIRLDENFNLANAGANSPAIDSTYQRRQQSRGTKQVAEAMKWRIAATVTDIRPNGIIVLEARKTIRADRDSWVYTLTGKIRQEDIVNNTVRSENMADGIITKHATGKVRDATRRGWLAGVLDVVSPF